MIHSTRILNRSVLYVHLFTKCSVGEMAMVASEDAISSDHFDGNNKNQVFQTNNERVKLGVRRKRRQVVMSRLGKPFALMRTSRIKKDVIPVGKEVGGYKKAQKQQHNHWDVKKRSQGKKSIAQVRESESDNKDLVEPFVSKTVSSEDEEDSEDDFCGMRSRREAWFKLDLSLLGVILFLLFIRIILRNRRCVNFGRTSFI
ncbi:unnamed protein product [Lactuca saligna]|uniref:Uncharacterized protein n=1 Tax=Lactuca saligna TaxID=75948 RepID=A0AA35ZZ75_LACSI|nr:unnamed protein product [Lactuca saligna]